MTTVVEPKTKQCLLQEKYADLIGAPITLTEAAEKYQVPRHAIRDWVYQAKYIRFVDTASYPQKIDEAEVALCRDIYNDRKQTGLTGIPFFDEDGYVITERKNEKLAEYRRRKKALG